MKYAPIAIAIIFGFLFSTGCVSSKKYKELEALKDFYKNESESLKAVEQEKNAAETENRQLHAKLKQKEDNLEDAVRRIEALEKMNRELLAKYDKLLEENKGLLQASSSEIRDLTEKLSAQSNELDARSLRLDSLQQELAKKEKTLNEWQVKIDELNKALDAEEKRIAEIKEKIRQAFLKFSTADMSVSEKNGKLYVSMSQNLLFKSGSDNIDVKGKDALRQLAEILKANPDLEILVEGHTDTDGTAAFNWDLSTSRATSVVKELSANGVEPERLVAAGRSFFAPVAPNDTAENKSKNRRVEIILSPQLEELLKIIRS